MASNRNMWIGLGVLGLFGWYLYSRNASAAAATGLPVATGGGGLAPPAPVPGSAAPTTSQITAAQAIWQNLTTINSPTSGFVNFPSGSQAAAALLPFATDGAGNSYTQWAGVIYIVSSTPDGQGNYSAKLLGS